jgi:hypothetical protein
MGRLNSYADALTGLPSSIDYLALAKRVYGETAQYRSAMSLAHHTTLLVKAQSEFEFSTPCDGVMVQMSSSPDRYVQMVISMGHLDGLKTAVVDLSQVDERIVDVRMVGLIVDTLEERWHSPFPGEYYCRAFVALPGLCVAAELWGGNCDEGPDTVKGPTEYCTVDFDSCMDSDELRLDVFDCSNHVKLYTETYFIPVGLTDQSCTVMDGYSHTRGAGCGIDEAWAGAAS